MRSWPRETWKLFWDYYVEIIRSSSCSIIFIIIIILTWKAPLSKLREARQSPNTALTSSFVNLREDYHTHYDDHHDDYHKDYDYNHHGDIKNMMMKIYSYSWNTELIRYFLKYKTIPPPALVIVKEGEKHSSHMVAQLLEKPLRGCKLSLGENFEFAFLAFSIFPWFFHLVRNPRGDLPELAHIHTNVLQVV